jgi:hypothetical protein
MCVSFGSETRDIIIDDPVPVPCSLFPPTVDALFPRVLWFPPLLIAVGAALQMRTFYQMPEEEGKEHEVVEKAKGPIRTDLLIRFPQTLSKTKNFKAYETTTFTYMQKKLDTGAYKLFFI